MKARRAGCGPRPFGFRFSTARAADGWDAESGVLSARLAHAVADERLSPPRFRGAARRGRVVPAGRLDVGVPGTSLEDPPDDRVLRRAGRDRSGVAIADRDDDGYI